ncbi:monovalent cation:proton antiporter-2 (CPA2) family protein [Thalassotalea agarivorans]|uniref:Kef-type potassium/proton antiporter, CPA2 family (TC 2.A.37.1) n=1 Tax=Thalassotalea agarivorans TaxID=349064 RepID=A0A1I0BKS5_THASX|nr:monovalent cation:proton antiporter-2 (CPA2) family protein [Thalassotalea agarivorans]SET06862.1 Kef-type potassium/proton antiporter, CPA2 family (TC 2.A.37.1) [Thalassotalea agarivorans]
MTSIFIQAFIYLFAAVIAVPLAKKLGLGSVLGYLIAGVIIGPVIGLVGQETTAIQHFAEFGVVMMLFLVGLELEPKMLWNMKSKLIGLGGLQVSLTVVIVMAIALAFGQPVTVAIAIGLIFSLSSTAIVLQSLNEKGLNKSSGGQSAFSVLLMQDIAVIPMLAFIPMLALPELVEAASSLQTATEHHEELSLVAGLPSWAYGLAIIASISAVIFGGHFLSRPLFKYVANSGLREIFVATALLLVIGIAALMSLVGLSPALGTFLAGVVLANSEFKHELETNIEPFKGLLLGLFFITVGAGINFDILSQNLTPILVITAAVILIKGAILYVLAIIFKVKGSNRWLFALSLAQVGEFGFVLLSFSLQNNVLSNELASMLQLVVAISMFLTPLLFILYEKVILRRYELQSNEQGEYDQDMHKGTVIIAGVGRFGQIVNRMLTANGINTVVLDRQATQVQNLRSINIKSYYGDASRPDLLHTAGIETADMIVIAIDDKEEAVSLTHHIKHSYPKVKILARSFDKGHTYELRDQGADIIVAETYFSALEMGASALTHLGFHPFDIEQKKHAFNTVENNASDELYNEWKKRTEGEKFGQDYRTMFMTLEETIKTAMEANRLDKHNATERGWTPPPKDYLDDFKD